MSRASPAPISRTGSEARQTTFPRLKELPPSTPRLVVKRGGFTFRKGVRIREYKILKPLRYRYTHRSRQFRCQDGFNLDEASLGKPQPMTRTMKVKTTIREEGTEKRVPTPSTPSLPLASNSSRKVRCDHGELPAELTSGAQPSDANREQVCENDIRFNKWLSAGEEATVTV